MTYFNKAQPIRPDFSESGDKLFHRTQPKRSARPPKFFRSSQVAMAMRLYRAVIEGAIPNGAAINDIYEYCVFPNNMKEVISKHQLGFSVIHAVQHEPRVLKNQRQVGAWMTYLFPSMLDLQYGLEWQICAPLWFIFEWEGQDLTNLPSREAQREYMDEQLRDLASLSHREYLSIYEQPLFEYSERLAEREPNWREIWKKFPERTIPLEKESLPTEADRPAPPVSKW